MQPSTAIDVLKSNSPSLVSLFKKLGTDGLTASRAILTIMLEDLISFFNVGKTMDKFQMAQTVDLILEDYSQYKPDHFVLCFKNAKKGMYGDGKMFDRIDGQIILNWLREHEFNSTIEIENFRAKEKKVQEKSEPVMLGPFKKDEPIPMPDDVRKEIRSFIAKIGKEDNKKQIKKMSEVEYHHHLRIARWDKQFSNLYRKLGVNISGFRFLDIKGRKYSLQEFLQLKLDNLSKK